MSVEIPLASLCCGLSSSSVIEAFGGAAEAPLTIALINNMSDGALLDTERQFCALLGAASAGLTVRLKVYSLPGIVRRGSARGHVAACYEDFDSLADDPPDGLIVTGAEPRAARLTEEAFWPALARLVELCHDKGVPGIWSCLAAHAAVLQSDGIARVPQKQKLAGVFSCRVARHKHGLLHGLAPRWQVPHSRHNGLRRGELERHGYDIVSWSRDAGIDMFIRRGECVQLYLQGHPEYAAHTLLLEFRRDVLRFAAGRLRAMPVFPLNVGHKLEKTEIWRLNQAVEQGDAGGIDMCIDTILGARRCGAVWSAGAVRLYENWLAYVDMRKARLAGESAALAGCHACAPGHEARHDMLAAV